MLIHSAVITGSVQLNNTDVSSITNVSGFATTASVNSLVVRTGSFATTSSVNELQSKTGSYASTSSVNNLQSVTGLYATTGSNQFNGNQSISGSIVSNGTITAQTLVVQTVTSSVEFVTGSTRNGSLLTNTHQFTGSVGITGSAAALLNVNNSVLYVSSSGNIGIGTSSPGTPLEIRFNADSFSWGSVATLYGYLTWGTAASFGENVAVIKTPASTGVVFQPAGSEKMRITSTGNVGIGTTSPGYKLHVSGSSEVGSRFIVGGTYAPIQFSGDGGTTLGGVNAYSTNVVIGRGTSTGVQSDLIINSSGNVGIGTASPGSKLDVSGTANVSSVLSAGAFQGPIGSTVTSVGYGATTLGSYDLNNLGEGMYIVTGYMVRGGVGINETYTQTWFYSRLPGGSAYVSTIANNGGPGNCYGGVSISGTTVSIGWCGQRGPAAIMATRLRDAF
jgi:hypothetical protein